MKEQDVKDFIGKAFRFEIVKSMKLKTNHTCWPGIPYYEVKFEDGSTEIQIYETSATWFKVSGLDEDIVSYSSEWRIFSFERMLKRNEVNEESFEKFLQGICNDIESTVEAEMDDRLYTDFDDVLGGYIEELVAMDKYYFDYLRQKTENANDFILVNQTVDKVILGQLQVLNKQLNLYLEQKVPVSINEQGQSVYNFDYDENNAYECFINSIQILDETRRYHIYLNDQKEEELLRPNDIREQD